MTLSESKTTVGIPRAQSSLELLSQTAAVIEREEESNKSSISPVLVDSSLSPIGIYRVTPAESSMEQQQQKLSLPEMVGPKRYMLQPRLVENAASNNVDTTSWMPNTTASSDDPNGMLNTSAFLASPSFGSTQSSSAGTTHNHTLEQENYMLKSQLAAKDNLIDNLNQQLQTLQSEIRRLRQMPSGKISQIPLEDMLAIMREYGSEVSDTAMPPRKTYVQKASVVRQFRRWNPNFLDWFEYSNGTWLPKLGKTGELKRRQAARKDAAESRRQKNAKKVSSF